MPRAGCLSLFIGRGRAAFFAARVRDDYENTAVTSELVARQAIKFYHNCPFLQDMSPGDGIKVQRKLEWPALKRLPDF